MLARSKRGTAKRFSSMAGWGGQKHYGPRMNADERR
jgi:hypothetical protein